MHRARVAAFVLIVSGILLGLTALQHSSSAAIACDSSALISAIQNAVTAGGTQTITLAPECTYTLTAADNTPSDPNGLPIITGVNLTINGSRTTIDRDASAPRFRFFDVRAGATLRLRNLRLTHGYTADGASAANGGDGGAIKNAGTLRVTGGRIGLNQTGQGGAANGDLGGAGNSGSGGGIYNSGTLDVVGVLFDSNQTAPGFQDVYSTSNRGSGGAIYNVGTLTVSDATFKSNTGGIGGAIENFGANATISRVTFESNTGDTGGGFSNYNAGSASLTNCTFYNNTSNDEGGAIWSDGTITVNFCTLDNNHATANEGGGVYNEAGTFTISNTILANNASGGNCAVGVSAVTITDGGYNIDDGTTCGFSPANNSQSSTDPKFDPNGLQYNGGVAKTIALQLDSPAIDKIDNGVNGCGTTVPEDERQVPRPNNNACDIGAYETACAAPPPDMLSWWPADDNARDIRDGHDGTLHNGATYDEGKVGDAFSLDGVDDYVDVGDVDLPSTFTIDAWINPSDLSSQPMILSKDDGNTRSYYFEIGTAGQLGAEVITSDGDTQYLSSSGVVVTNQWQHVAMTYDGSAGADQKIKFYVNGAQVTATHLGSNDAGGTPNDTDILALIGLYGNDSFAFKGLIDEVEVFGRALDSDEIASISGASARGKCRSLCASAPGSMVSWWKAEGDTVDSEDGNDGIFNGTAAYTSGEVGQGFSLNGSDQYVEVADSPSLSFTGPFSIDAWINTNDNTTEHGIVEKYDGGGQNGYFLRLSPGGLLTFGVCDASGCSSSTGGPVVTTGTFHHVAAVFDGSNLVIYLDGVGVVTSGPVTAPTDGTNPLFIGSRGGNPGNFFNGIIDEVEIFNRALSDREVQRIYDAQSGGKCPCVTPPDNMIAWWPGDDNAKDIQGGHDGTVEDATFSSGEVSDAFTFDGTDDDVSIPASNDWNFGTGDFAFDFWAKSSSSDRQHALSFEPDPTFQSNNLDFDFNDVDAGIYVYWNGGGGNFIAAGTPGTYTDGQWHHYALTRSGSTLTLFIDGTAVGSANYSDAINLSGGSNNYIGASTGQVTPSRYFWNGQVDEVEIFTRALSPDEIRALYSAGGAGKCKSEVMPTPTPSPTPTPTPTVSPTPGGGGNDVEGSGAIVVPGGEAHFSINVSRRRGEVRGTLSYDDPQSPFAFSTHKFKSLVIDGNHAHLTGVIKRGKHNKISFTVDVIDNGEPGTLDTFSITTSNGYSAGGNLISGNVRVD